MAEVARPRHPWTSILSLVGMSALLLILVIITGQRIAGQAIKLRDTTDQVMVISRAAQTILGTVNDAAASAYSFASQRNPAVLDNYWRATPQIMRDMRILTQQARDYPWLPPLVEILKTSIANKMEELRHGIDEARIQPLERASAAALYDPNDIDLVSIRRITEEIVNRAWAERERRSEKLDQTLQQSARVALLLVLIGVPMLGVIASRVLTTRKRIAESQRIAQLHAERLKSAINQIPAGVAVFDADERLVLWNANFFASSSFPSRLRRSGTSYEAFFEVMQGWQPPVPHPGTSVRPIETRFGRRVLEIWQGDMPGGGYILVINDITRRTEAEMMVHQAGKMESLGQLIGGMAHDFNNLLQVITTNLDLIAAGIGDQPAVAKNLAAAMAGVNSAARLTKQLLSFARRQPLITAPVDFTGLLVKFEDIIRRTVGPSIILTTTLQPALWPLLADASQLEAALLNLVLNARDAMPHGGSLVIEAINVSLTNARSGDLRPGDYVVITVTDTGVGMSREQLARAVEPFYTTKPDGQGTGLGLSMVYGFMSQVGGTLRIKSEPGHGTTVQLSFPRAPGLPQELADNEAASSAPPGHGELILVVDDDNAVRAATCQSVSSLGYQVCEAASGMEAIDLIKNGLRPAMIFSDVVMPGSIDGVALAQFAAHYDPSLPVLLTSGYTEHPDTQARIAGINILPKPWRVEDLARHLSKTLAVSHSSEHPAQTAPASTRILLVDDDALLLEVTSGALISLGYQVTAVADAKSAITAAEQALFNLLVCDRHLPDMDGVHLALFLRRTRPQLPVIIISGDPPGLSLRGMIWLQKPFTIKSLRSSIGDLLAAYTVM